MLVFIQRSYTRIDSNIDLRNVQLKKCSLLWGEENSVISTDIETELGGRESRRLENSPLELILIFVNTKPVLHRKGQMGKQRENEKIKIHVAL